MKSFFRCLLVTLTLFNNINLLYGQWVQTKCPPNLQVDCFVVSGTNIFAGISSGVLLSTDNGNTWSVVGSGQPGYPITALAVLGKNLFAATAGGGVYLSTNNGKNWEADTIGLEYKYVRALAVLDNNIFAGTNGGVYLSTNNGENWLSINSDDVKALAVSGTDLFDLTGFGSLHISSNNGTTWTTIYIHGVPSINAFTVLGTNLFLGVIGGNYLSTNNGATWIADTSGFNHTSVNSFTTYGTNLLIGTGGKGVYLSNNNGTNWPADTVGLMGNSITALAIIGANIFAGTSTEGSIWRRPLSEIITKIKDDRNQIPAQFELEQNYPNPFNPSTKINFTLPKASKVKITIYNQLGQQVTTLVDGEYSGGPHELNFNASNLASGIYYYRIEAGSFNQTKKMMLMK